MLHLPSRAARRFRAMLADERGGSAVMLALAFPVMIGGLALGAEAGYWLLVERQLQHAADMGAHAAGVVKRSGADTSEMQAAALRAASGSGSQDSSDTIELFSPPQTGAYAGDSTAVEVRLRRAQRRFFSLIYATGTVPIGVRAVAQVEDGATACVLALSTSASGAVTVSGSTAVTFEGCDIASNSNAADSFLMANGASVLSTGCVNTVGGALANAGLTLTDCSAIRENGPVIADPYADVPEPALEGTCQSGTLKGKPAPLTVTAAEDHSSGMKSMRFCSGVDVDGVVHFEPGLYIIESGTFRVNSNAVVTGSGVTFFLNDGVELAFNGTAQIQFSAPDTGVYSGLLFFGDRDSTTVETHLMNGTALSSFDGAVYAPSGDLEFKGNLTWAATGCTQLVASTILFTGNSTLQVDCQATGTKPIKVREKVRLVE